MYASKPKNYADPPKIDPAVKAALKNRMELEELLARRARARNAFPVFPIGTIVRTDVTGCCFVDMKVESDPGPASDGGRKIVLRRADSDGSASDVMTVRRDRARPLPGQVIEQKAAAGSISGDKLVPSETGKSPLPGVNRAKKASR